MANEFISDVVKPFFAALAATIVVAVGAMYALDVTWQRRADQAFVSTTSVRLPGHGNIHNLVGKSWYSAKAH